MNCTTHHHACECREAKFAAKDAEIARLREALEFYADKKNWTYVTLNRDLNDCGVISAYRDEGAFARKALKGE